MANLFQFHCLASAMAVIAISNWYQLIGCSDLEVSVKITNEINENPNSNPETNPNPKPSPNPNPDPDLNTKPITLPPYNQSEPLFLTPYIEANKINEARKLSKVPDLGFNLTSYSGFLTVNKQYDSQMFFWFFPALSGKADAPILLWLQGGPGVSSLFGLFVENGPLQLDSEIKPHLRNTTWNQFASMLYIDNPVGTGYSFTKNDLGFARNETDVAENLYKALEQFFQLFQELQPNPFYVAGDSYAGKYVPSISYKIYKMVDRARTKINLKGMIIGDGWLDPNAMLDYGEQLYQVGLLDEIQRDYFKQQELKAKEAAQNKDFIEAALIINDLLYGGGTGDCYFKNITGLTFYNNYLLDHLPDEYGYFKLFVVKPAVRQAIHVGQLPFDDQTLSVLQYLAIDSATNGQILWIEELLNAGYRILFYNGQFDSIITPPAQSKFLQSLQWKGQQKIKQSVRTIYRANPKNPTVSGYVHQADNLLYVLIRNSGHIVPYDQPVVAQDMIRRFVFNESFINY